MIIITPHVNNLIRHGFNTEKEKDKRRIKVQLSEHEQVDVRTKVNDEMRGVRGEPQNDHGT